MRRQAYYNDASDMAHAFTWHPHSAGGDLADRTKRKKVRTTLDVRIKLKSNRRASNHWRARYNGSQFYLDENDGMDLEDAVLIRKTRGSKGSKTADEVRRK